MGTWDIGPFDNDTAADFGGKLDEAAADARGALVREALDAGGDEEKVAAAALVAADCPGGEPVDTAYGPKEPLPDLSDLRDLARVALDGLVDEPSELAELWAESGDDSWRAGVVRLRDLLASAPTGRAARPA
ncbi:DUF4259 domain-containing protein [Streptomyces uncialis]|uniref:DUF4259 domain-containing protein n=1 Tax=Streptomyces uncialis TaxID=1048205 RepID=UPI0034053FF1